MLMDLFLQLRGTIYDRGDKLHFNDRQIPLYFKLQISPFVSGFWALKVEPRYQVGRTWGQADCSGRHGQSLPLPSHRFACSHASPPFRGLLVGSICG